MKFSCSSSHSSYVFPSLSTYFFSSCFYKGTVYGPIKDQHLLLCTLSHPFSAIKCCLSSPSPRPLLPHQLFPFSLDYFHQHTNNLLFHSSYKKKKTHTHTHTTGFLPHFLFQLLFLLIGKLLKGISYNCSLNFLPAFSLEPISSEFSSPAELCLAGSSVTSTMLLLKVNSQSSPCLTYKHCRTQMGEGNGTPLQYSYLENPMDGGDW